MKTALSWIPKQDREKIHELFRNTALPEVERRHWGTRAPGRSPGRVVRCYILDVRGLLLMSGILNYALRPHGCRVLFRGQNEDWELRPALFRGTTTKVEARERIAWLDGVLNKIAHCFDRSGTANEREALAQHYGLPTRWLDVVDNVQTAAWFAYDRAGNPENRDSGVGYIQAISCPEEPSLCRALDLRTKPSEWLRPHIQQAWSFRQARPESGLGRLNDFHLATFIVPRPLLRAWSAHDALTRDTMFPNKNQDTGCRYWIRAADEIEKHKFDRVSWYVSDRDSVT